MGPAGHSRKHAGLRRAANYADALCGAACLVVIGWGVVTVCRRAGRVWRCCRVLRAAGRLLRAAGEW